ncbi:hypothetical protein J437_LFUL017857 [Ladona fulva]|uniref:Lipid droplet-associated hydrolase n=1 Tax=Ladona fulva TaxID=123851 RepID=A0A8K0PA51_LADFU|nr:hypothetical protein J437_LFUL017857 [Ladona fulva]
MTDKYYDINGVPTRVLQCGGKPSKEMILIIPGNPGMVHFYVDFMKCLYDRLGMSVATICHAGHELPPDDMYQPSLKGNQILYGLDGQVKHKKEFITKFLPDNIPINVIGHSIGCKIILELLKDEEVNFRLQKNILLFPTVERLAETPNGKFFVKMDKYFHTAIKFMIYLLHYFPHFIKIPLIRVYSKIGNIPSHFEKAISDLVSPSVLEKVFFMAQDEMKKVRELDADVIRNYLSNIYLYYGLEDGWCPRYYYEELKTVIPEAKAELCKVGYKHAFVLSSPIEMGNIVADWIDLQ